MKSQPGFSNEREKKGILFVFGVLKFVDFQICEQKGIVRSTVLSPVHISSSLSTVYPESLEREDKEKKRDGDIHSFTEPPLKQARTIFPLLGFS